MARVRATVESHAATISRYIGNMNENGTVSKPGGAGKNCFFCCTLSKINFVFIVLVFIDVFSESIFG